MFPTVVVFGHIEGFYCRFKTVKWSKENINHNQERRADDKKRELKRKRMSMWILETHLDMIQYPEYL